jgi:HSP20 family protein
MRVGSLINGRGDFDELFQRFFENPTPWPTGGYEVPTDIFHTDGALVIRMDLPGVGPEDVEVTTQENTLLVNGTRKFAYDAENVRFVRRGTFYGDFAQRVALGKGLDAEHIKANFSDGVLELTIPHAEEVKPRKVEIEVGKQSALTA